MTWVDGRISYGKEIVPYQVQFLASRRTLAIEVHPDCRVFVRAPVGTDMTVVSARVRKRAAWIVRQLDRFASYRPLAPERRYVSGESHRYLGRQYRLKIKRNDGPVSVAIHPPYLTVTTRGDTGSDRVKSLLRQWYLDQAKSVFRNVLAENLRHFGGAPVPRVIVRTMKRRWGSLSPSGTMTLNVNLVKASRACIEYVIVHELCHLTSPRHDERFYRQLSSILPDWRLRKSRLEIALT